MDNEEKACIRIEWEPGVEINSEAEYIAMTQHLAKGLLSDNTPEQLAVIAAQHLIYADQLKMLNTTVAEAAHASEGLVQQQKKQSDALIDRLRLSISTQEAAKICTTVLKAHKKHNAVKGAKARHKDSAELKIILLAEWDALHDEHGKLDKKHGYKGRSDFSRIISKREGIIERTLYNWLTEHERAKKCS